MKVLLLSIFILCFIGCSGQKGAGSEADFSISLGLSASGVSNLQGGVTLFAESLDPDIPDFSADLDANFQAEIPFGSYNILLVGWDGPGAWSGTMYCGAVPVLLDQPAQSVSITLNQANCSSTVYSSLIASKGGSLIAEWDVAQWDSAQWQ